ncbi:LacI family DNA-binding transcriptional regulator [Ktedonospora formicarum]|uniref:LacI family transcriptional regulator n=1 Tax=Ktedonospora formicarum TaxID=2778364 RepID=A0A8J3I7L7_9CHLR|nr:LacI family DNA-binding transcriptional regulator [Ktedonospora formicarum]GHO51029.1 LacI family transcriptional regulator [Ktedonospora formicarum]
MRKRRSTQADVAALAHVSPAIVSLVINGHMDGNVRISAQTRQRVWDAIRELGYVANPVARKLAGSQNRLLGVFTYQAIFPLEYHDFYYPFLIGIEEEAQAQDYDLLLFTRPTTNGKRSIYKEGINSLQMADGALLLGVYQGPDEITQLMQEGYPFVYVGRRDIPGMNIPYVAADYVAATVQVVEYMHSLGHRRIAYLSKQDRIPYEAHYDRQSGYLLAHQRLEMVLDERLLIACDLEAITPALLQQYLSLGVTALLFEDISYAHKLLNVTKQMGMSVPHDLSFALLGDPLNETQHLTGMTGFSIPRREMGKEAVHLLINLLQGNNSLKGQQLTLPCTFMKGNTVMPPTHL